LGRGRESALKIFDPQSFDHLASEYDFVAALERSPAFFLQHLPPQSRRILDIGCGTGILASELARHAAFVLALDISDPMLAIAREKRSAPNIEYRLADANHLVLTEKFDAIVSHTTFHHLADVSATVQALKAALNPGGRLIFIDNVARFPLIPRHPSILIARTSIEFVLNLFRFGSDTARRMFRFYTSNRWLNHMKTDQYFSPAEFQKLYGQLLPGASFSRQKYFMGVVWQSPLA